MRYRGRPSATVALTAVLLALATCLGYVESVLLPGLPVPGARIGIANIAVLLALVTMGPARAAVVSIGRVVLVGLATGTFAGPAFLLALVGAVAALLAMDAIRRAGERFSVVGWSIAGSAAHVLAQLGLACVVVGSSAPLLMTPLSLGMALLSGIAIGFASRLLLSRIPSLSLSVA